jgi:hypothetical protein
VYQTFPGNCIGLVVDILSFATPTSCPVAKISTCEVHDSSHIVEDITRLDNVIWGWCSAQVVRHGQKISLVVNLIVNMLCEGSGGYNRETILGDILAYFWVREEKLDQ